MGRSATYASDGTPRCSEPRQDAEGRWYCPACGRAEGFKSKMAVLGHLRACRPGRPAIQDLLTGASSALPASSAPVVYLPTPSEVAQANGMGAILSRLDQMAQVQASHSRALGNHITHLSAAAGGATSGASGVPVAWLLAGLAGLGLVAAASQRPAPPAAPVRNPFKEGKRRRDHRAMCAGLEARRLAGENVTVPESCAELDEDPVAAAPPPPPPPARSSGLGDLLDTFSKTVGTATKAQTLLKNLKNLKA